MSRKGYSVVLSLFVHAAEGELNMSSSCKERWGGVHDQSAARSVCSLYSLCASGSVLSTFDHLIFNPHNTLLGRYYGHPFPAPRYFRTHYKQLAKWFLSCLHMESDELGFPPFNSFHFQH